MYRSSVPGGSLASMSRPSSGAKQAAAADRTATANLVTRGPYKVHLPACASAWKGKSVPVAVFARHLGFELELVLEVHRDGGFGSLEEVRDSDQRGVDAVERELADAGQRR